MIFTETYHLVAGKHPVADAFTGTVTSDVVNMRNFQHVTFIFYNGVGTTGTSTITVLACDDVTPTNTTAVAFRYRAITSGDTPGALTAATTAGFTTTAGSNHMYAIEVDAEDLATSGYEYVQISCVEVADDPVLGGIMIILGPSRYPRSVQKTAIV